MAAASWRLYDLLNSSTLDWLQIMENTYIYIYRTDVNKSSDNELQTSLMSNIVKTNNSSSLEYKYWCDVGSSVRVCE